MAPGKYRSVGRRLVLACLLVGSLLAAGCATSSTVQDVATTIEGDLGGGHLERESHIRIGGLTMAMARGIARMAADLESEERAALRSVRSVEVATYRVHGAPTEGGPPSLRQVETRLMRQGWQPMVRERDGHESTWVWVKGDPEGRLRGIVVVDYDGSELEVVRVRGRLDRVLAEAMADDPDSAVEIFGP
jgi:hypothetical protein